MPHSTVFDELTAEEIALLRELAQDGGPVSEARLAADSLRTLALRRYVKRLSGFSIVTPEGRRALEAIDRGEQPHHPGPRPAAFPGLLASRDEEAPAADESADTTLNPMQEDMLRQLALAEDSVPFDDLDGRVVRALEGRELVRRTDGRVEITEAGKAFYESRVRRRRRVRSGWVRTGPPTAAAAEEGRPDERTVRARSIREAVDALRRAVGGTETIPIEDLDAPAEDAFRAFLELADRIERGADPRRIKRG